MKRLAFAAFLFFLPAVSHADSLFATPANAPSSSLFADTKARRVGDTLTILIDESASASSSAATKTSKTESVSFGPGFGGYLLSRINKIGVGGTISSAASGNTNRTDNLTARIAVTVKEVLPNGNLVIEGKRKVGINAETQEIVLTGIVRTFDISPENTVASALVADAQIKLNGKGPVGDKQRDGIITRIFKVLF